MNQKEVLEFDGFRVERESFLGGDCYGVVTSCKKDEKGVSYHLEVEFDTSTAKFHFSKCYAHEVVPCQELSAGGKFKVMAYLIEKAASAYVTEKAAVQKMSFEKLNSLISLLTSRDLWTFSSCRIVWMSIMRRSTCGWVRVSLRRILILILPVNILPG